MLRKIILAFCLFGLSACQLTVAQDPTQSPIARPPDGPDSSLDTDIGIITVTQSGGLTGKVAEEWQIQPDGTILKNGVMVGKVAQDRLDQLFDDLDKTGIFVTGVTAREPVACPDCILIRIAIRFPERELVFYDLSGTQTGAAHQAAQVIDDFLQEVAW